MPNVSSLYKSTIVIWSRENPERIELEDLAHRAMYGSDAYLSKHGVELVDRPEEDHDWDGTDFFDTPDTGNEGWASEFPDERSTSESATVIHDACPSGITDLAGNKTGETGTKGKEPGSGSNNAG